MSAGSDIWANCFSRTKWCCGWSWSTIFQGSIWILFICLHCTCDTPVCRLFILLSCTHFSGIHSELVSWCPELECAVSGQMLSSRKEKGSLCNCWRRPGKGGFDVILTQNQITGTRQIKLEFDFQIPGSVITLFLYANTKGENVTFWRGLGNAEQQYFGTRCV